MRNSAGLVAGLTLAWRVGAALALLAVAGCAVAPQDPRSEQQRAADDAIKAQVRERLLADPSIYAYHVMVVCRERVVYLSGYVFSGAEAQSATRLAAGVPGVREVRNEIDVQAELMRPNR